MMPDRARFMAVIFASAIVGACAGTSPTAPISGTGDTSARPERVAKLRLNTSHASLRLGRDTTLEVTFLGSSGTPMQPEDQLHWSSSDTAIAAVDHNGTVHARGAGQTTIHAKYDDLSAAATVVVVDPSAARLVISSSFEALEPGASTTLETEIENPQGDPGDVTWTSLAPKIAKVTSDGKVTGVATGTAQIVAKAGELTDTVTVAVAGKGASVLTALPGGAATLDVKRGETVTLPVLLDLSKISSNGDLGSIQFQVRYDPEVLDYEAATALVSGANVVHLIEPGRVSFASAATKVQGTARLAIVTMKFRVAVDAPLGTGPRLDIDFASAPTSTGFRPISMPLFVSGRIRVVAS